VDTSPAIYGFQIGIENIRDIYTSLNAIQQSTRLSKKDLHFRMFSTILSHAKPLSMKSERLLHQLRNLVVIHLSSESMELERQA
jgi:hypothetical protein